MCGQCVVIVAQCALRQGLPVRAWLRAVACPGKAAQTAGYIARRARARQIKCIMASGYRAMGLRVCKTKCRQPYPSVADYLAMGLRVCMTKCAVLSRPGLVCGQSHTHGPGMLFAWILVKHATCICVLHGCCIMQTLPALPAASHLRRKGNRVALATQCLPA